MQRRTFLKGLGVAPIVAYFPASGLAQQTEQKILILVQLAGGNDSLNMCVPYAEPAYYQARENLAINQDEVLTLTGDLGLNPVMASLLPAWQNADLAVVQGLGYPQPNRSHFRSIDIWHTATDADQYAQFGWLHDILPQSEYPLQGVMISGSPGALKGEQNQFHLGAQNKQLKPVYLPQGTTSNAMLEHIVNQRQSYNHSIDIVNAAFAENIQLSSEFAADEFSKDCELIAQTLAAGIRPTVIHLSLGSFDTHSNQRAQHDNLLMQLANGLASLRTELLAQGLWQQVCIASYSEFGRRVASNASGGTDHGTSASHLVMGGDIKGGIYGQAPSLTDLDNGDLIFTEDFRDYYRSLSDWMQWQPSDALADFTNLGFVAG